LELLFSNTPNTTNGGDRVNSTGHWSGTHRAWMTAIWAFSSAQSFNTSVPSANAYRMNIKNG